MFDEKVIKAASKLGEPQKVIVDILRDCVLRKIVELNQVVRKFERKYGVSFKEFEKRDMLNQLGHTWDVEENYYEWDRAVTELGKLEDVLMELG